MMGYIFKQEILFQKMCLEKKNTSRNSVKW